MKKMPSPTPNSSGKAFTIIIGDSPDPSTRPVDQLTYEAMVVYGPENQVFLQGCAAWTGEGALDRLFEASGILVSRFCKRNLIKILRVTI